MHDFFMKTSQSGLLFYLIVPGDVKKLNVPLCRESWFGNVGQKAVNIISCRVKVNFIKCLCTCLDAMVIS